MEGRTPKVNLAHIARPITEEKTKQTFISGQWLVLTLKKKSPGYKHSTFRVGSA